MIKVSLTESFGQALQQLGREVSQDAIRRVEGAVATIGEDAFQQLKVIALAKLDSTAQQYLDALDYQMVAPGVSVITLGAEAAHLEKGYCVLYNPKFADKLQPKVYTEKGWTPVTKIVVGDMVLNQYGEYTKVSEVHSNPIFGRFSIGPEIEKTGTKYSSTPRSLHDFTCERCGYVKRALKLTAPRACNKCGIKEFIHIEMENAQHLKLTLEHQVMTQRGWMEAQNLTLVDEILWFSGKQCERCLKPCRNRFCSKNCSATTNNNKLISEGRHPSQIAPKAFRDRYIKNLEFARKNGSLVNSFLSFLPYTGTKELEWPVKCVHKEGKKTCFWLDIYIPEFNLGIEMDGVQFHKGPRDSIRDALIKDQHNIDILRITNVEWKNDVKGCIERVMRRLGNHSGDAAKSMAFKKPHKIERRQVFNGFNLTHKWDITVENGESFVCQGAVIHNSGFDMKPGLLRNAKKRSKAGYRYRSIPFTHQGKGKEGSDKRQMWSDLRQMKKVFGLDKTTEFSPGKPVLGKVAVVSRDSLGSWSVKGPTIEPRRTGQMPWSKNLAGVVKYQYKTPKGAVKSHYVTFRTVSENPALKGKWLHPGFDGIQAFPRLEEWIVNNLAKKVDEALRG